MAETPATATPTPPGEAQPAPTQPAEVIDTTGAKPVDVKPPEPPPPPKTYKRKVNGREEEIPAEAVDAAAKALGLTANELLSTSQLKRAAYEKFEEAQKLRAEYEKVKAIKDPWEAARAVAGLDDAALDKAAEDRLIAKLQREAMPPEQRQVVEAQERLARERADLEKQKAAYQEQVLAQEAQQVRSQLEPAILKAVEAAGLPRTPDAVRAVVSELERQMKYGMPFDVEGAVEETKAQFFKPSLSILKAMTAEQIVAELGPEKYAEVLKHSIAQKNGPTPVPTPPTAPVVPREAVKGYLTTKEWEKLYGA